MGTNGVPRLEVERIEMLTRGRRMYTDPEAGRQQVNGSRGGLGAIPEVVTTVLGRYCNGGVVRSARLELNSRGCGVGDASEPAAN